MVTSDILVTIDDEEVTALIDTGADSSIMSRELASKLKKVFTQWTGSHVRTAGGHLLIPVGRCTARVNIRAFTYAGVFIILPSCSRDLILGMDFLQANGAIINLEKSSVTFSTAKAIASDAGDENPTENALRIVEDSITVPPRSSLLTLVTCDAFDGYEGIAEANTPLMLERNICIARGLVQLQHGRSLVLLTNFSNEYQHLPQGTAVAFLHQIAAFTDVASLETASPNSSIEANLSDRIQINPGLSERQKQQLLDLINDFSGCFSTESKVRRTSVTKHRIPTDESARPVHQHPYRVVPTEREVIKRQVQEMLDDDVIQPSISPWASPVVLVKKKDNTLRFCVDYRRLNSVTKRDVYPLPRIDDALVRLRHAQFFNSLDLKSGYWQIEVDERDREKNGICDS